MGMTAGGVVAGRYRLDRHLGQGGMGTVWAATHLVTRREVAVKLLRPLHSARPDMRRRFVREARAAAAVGHPNVVEIHDVFELEDETPVIVMALLKGETLGQKLAREISLSLGETANVLLPVISAVGTAHSRGIIHRDLKPDNVFLAREAGAEQVKVLDFGIAKLADEPATLTGTGTMLGTPCYMAPEQAFGERDVDHRADIWSIGAMLYEMLTGGRPVEGENLGQVLKRFMTEGVTPIEAAIPDLPDDIARMTMSMLARERDQRPADLREVAAALRPFATVSAPEFGPPATNVPLRDSDPALSREIADAEPPVIEISGSTQRSALPPDSLVTTSADSPSRMRKRTRRWTITAAVVMVASLAITVWQAAVTSGSSAAAEQASPAAALQEEPQPAEGHAAERAVVPAAAKAAEPAARATTPEPAAFAKPAPGAQAPAARPPRASKAQRATPTGAPPVAESPAASSDRKPSRSAESDDGLYEKPPF